MPLARLHSAASDGAAPSTGMTSLAASPAGSAIAAKFDPPTFPNPALAPIPEVME